MDLGAINWDMVAALAQAFGFLGIVWGLFQNRRALQTQTAMEFYRRYGEIAGRMPDELRLPTHASREWTSLSDSAREQAQLALIDYFNLSSEEYALYRKGRLARDVWAVTRSEISGKLKRSLWKDGWRLLRSEYTSDPAFVRLMDQMADQKV